MSFSYYRFTPTSIPPTPFPGTAAITEPSPLYAAAGRLRSCTPFSLLLVRSPSGVEVPLEDHVS